MKPSRSAIMRPAGASSREAVIIGAPTHWLHRSNIRMSPAKTFTMSRLAITLDTSQVLGRRCEQRNHQDREVGAIAQWTVEDDASGYTRFYNPQGVYIARFPATPSNEYRRMRDLLGALKKAGLTWPPPSKKERRAQHRKEGAQ